jgi:hypothetical protein
MNSLGIYVENAEQIPYIDQILSSPQIQDQKYDDIFLISDNDVCHNKLGKINTFYIGFSNIDILFISLEDYINNKAIVPAKQTYVATTSQEILSRQLELKEIKNIRIIELCNMIN